MKVNVSLTTDSLYSTSTSWLSLLGYSSVAMLQPPYLSEVIMSFFYKLLHAKFFPPSNPTASFAGNTVLVTGGNCGLGFQAAIKFVTLGAATMILACRNPKNGEAAVAEMERRTGRVGVLRSWELDMTSTPVCRHLAARVAAELPQLNVVHSAQHQRHLAALPYFTRGLRGDLIN